MYRKTPAWAGWASLALGAMLVLVWFPMLGNYIKAVGTHDYSRIPAVSSEQFSLEQKAVMEDLGGPVSTDPHAYFRSAMHERRFNAIDQRFRHDQPVEWSRLNNGIAPGFMMSELENLQMRYERQHGHRVMLETADGMRTWMNVQEQLYAIGTPSGAFDGAGFWLLRGYIASCLLSVLFYMARLKASGFLIWPELVNGRLFAASLTGLGLAFIYPSRIDVVAQIKRAHQVVAAFLASAISFGAVGFANAGERKPGEDGSSGTSNVLTLSDLPMPKVSLSGGFMSAKVTGNGTRVNDGATYWADTNLSFQNGWDLDLWASRQARGFGSNENDYTLCKTSAAGKDTSATACLAYYDIVPVGSGKDGDMVSPSLGFSKPLGHGITAFAKADAYLMTGGPRSNGGYDIVLGVKGATHAGPVEFDHSLAAVYAGGPFGQKEGASLRFDESAAIPLTDKLKAVLNLKAFAPFKGARDRGKDVSAGIGLAYAFN